MSQGMPMQGPAPDAAERVKSPAMGLMITAIIGIVVCLISLAMNLLGAGLGAAGAAADGDPAAGVANMVSGGMGMFSAVLGLLMGGFIFYASQKMQRLENYGMALAASIVAMVPCVSPCCIIGLPIGIWALIVLMKPEIKAAFTS